MALPPGSIAVINRIEHVLSLPIGFSKMDSHNEEWMRALTKGLLRLIVKHPELSNELATA
jgi:hypothetical protein